MNAKAEIKDAVIIHKNVWTALAAAQAQMGKLVKDSLNPHFKSKYADLAALMATALPALNSNGLTIYHQITNEGHTMRTVLMHGESETAIECDVPLIVAKNDMQGFKSATTYAKRIGAESVTGLAPDDDDGNAAAAAAPTNQDRKAPSKNDETRKVYDRLQAQARENKTLADLESWWKDPELKQHKMKLPEDWQKNLKDEVTALANGFKNNDSPFSEAAE